jgi:hypothetical protein
MSNEMILNKYNRAKIAKNMNVKNDYNSIESDYSKVN